MQAVILAAGGGTRMRPLTDMMSKPMIPIANKPLLEWTVDILSDICDEIIIVIKQSQRDIIGHFQNFPHCKFAFQDTPKGTGDATACCESLIKERFIVVNGDEMISKTDIKKFSKLDGYAIGAFEVDNPEKFGVLDIQDGLIKNIEEKPQQPKGNLVNTGLYLLDKKIFDALRRIGISERGEIEITDALRILMDQGEEIKPFVLSRWVTISYPWQILDANQLILDEFGSFIGKNVEIRSGAYIEHPVAIGDNAVLGPNCFIRKYSVIGKGCRVGNAVEIKNSIIMDNTFVSHLSYVGDSIIGRNCNIAAGTIFANLRFDERNVGMSHNGTMVDSGRSKLGGIVGDNVKFGVNCVVMPGKKIWPNIMVPPCRIIDRDIEEQPDLKNWNAEREGYSD
jgi:bifunctional UDP-N-acetylglucosamine pyrophosphorylase/glucosamine-1-phosphate N-acetyltransferase